MSLFFADMVRETSWGTGTGDLPLEGALPGHRRFADTTPPGARFHYCIAGITHPDQWETGEGEIGSGGTLVRLPLASSAGGAIVDFAAGLKTVALTVAADWFAARDGGVAAIGNVAGLQEALDAKAPAVHGHATADISELQGLLDSKAPSDHVHAPSDIAGLEAELDGKAPAAHGHVVAEVAGLQAELDGKQPLDAKLTALAGPAGGADTLFYFTGPATAAATGLSAFGRDLIASTDAISTRSSLGLGTLATQAADGVAITGGSTLNLSASSIANDQNAQTGMRVDNPNSGTSASSLFDFRNGSLTTSDRLLFGLTGTGYTAVAGWTDTAIISALSGISGGLVLGVAAAAGIKFEVGGLGPANQRAALTATALNLSSGVALQVNGTQIVASRRTGWSSPGGTATRSAFATSTVTTAQLAERVKALIDDLTAHGLIGS